MSKSVLPYRNKCTDSLRLILDRVTVAQFYRMFVFLE